MQRAVFLDKDGTLIEDVPYNINVEKIRFAPYAFEALQQLNQLGFLLVIVTNQSGIARGYFGREEVENLHGYFSQVFDSIGIPLSGFYYCPHHPDAPAGEFSIDCDCRKPKPGMLRQAAHKLNIDLSASWMIGDILNDMEAGKSAGCNTILIDNGNETEWVLTPERQPDFTAADLKQAANIIKQQDRIHEKLG